MVILDSAIVVVALPSIDADLAFSAGDLQWVLSAYLLSFGGLLLLGGRAADLLGRRRMFIVGTGLFALASLGAGLAGTSEALLAARAVQGVAAAIMTPTALSIVMTTFPEGAERNKALGIWGSTGAIGGTAAWLVGGPITDGLGWEWIFFINVPVAAVVAALSPVLLRESRGAAGQRRFDAAGAVTITAALVALVYAVVEAPDAGWADGQTLGLLALAAVLTAVFAGIESRSAAPLAPLGVFRSRSLVGGNLVLFALGTMAFGVPVHPHPVRPGGPWLVADPLRARLGRHAGHRGGRNRHRAGDRHQGRRPPGRGRRDGAHRPGQPAAHAGVGRRHLPRRPLLRAGAARPGHRRRLRRGVDRVADRRRRDRRRAGVGPEQRVVPDRRRGRRGDPLHGRRVGRARRRLAGGAHRRLPVGLRRGDRGRGARRGGGRPAARRPARARARDAGRKGRNVEHPCGRRPGRPARPSSTRCSSARRRTRTKATRSRRPAGGCRWWRSTPASRWSARTDRSRCSTPSRAAGSSIAWYFMWYPGQPAADQCEGCTFYNGQVGELSYLHSRDITYADVLPGPVRGERPLPRLHGLGHAVVLGAGLRRRAARRAPRRHCSTWSATCATATASSRPTGPPAAASRRWPTPTGCWT